MISILDVIEPFNEIVMDNLRLIFIGNNTLVEKEEKEKDKVLNSLEKSESSGLEENKKIDINNVNKKEKLSLYEQYLIDGDVIIEGNINKKKNILKVIY